MGDRANVYVHEGDQPGVYLYTHWSGTELPGVVQKALASEGGRRRWDDGPYLARIVFEAMIDGSRGGESGYGIATFAPDGTDRVISLDVLTLQAASPGGRWSFEEFTKVDPASVFP
jgi:hypothetical protein